MSVLSVDGHAQRGHHFAAKRQSRYLDIDIPLQEQRVAGHVWLEVDAVGTDLGVDVPGVGPRLTALLVGVEHDDGIVPHDCSRLPDTVRLAARVAPPQNRKGAHHFIGDE